MRVLNKSGEFTLSTFNYKTTSNVRSYGHLQTAKWRLHRRSCEIAATDEERALQYLHTYFEREQEKL
jgi:hypothetical protein